MHSLASTQIALYATLSNLEVAVGRKSNAAKTTLLNEYMSDAQLCLRLPFTISGAM